MVWNVQLEFILRLFLSCISGALIGLERETRNKFAGVRTHIIVALGACFAMIISKYGFSDTLHFDSARVAAQIISGIGFLGAGVIFVKNDHISGLTTAAGVWTTSIIGMGYGSGMYLVAGTTTLFIILIQFLLYRNEYFTFGKILYTIKITTKDPLVLNDMEQYMQLKKITKKGMELSYYEDILKIDIKYLSKNSKERNELIKYLSSLESIISFKII